PQGRVASPRSEGGWGAGRRPPISEPPRAGSGSAAAAIHVAAPPQTVGARGRPSRDTNRVGMAAISGCTPAPYLAGNRPAQSRAGRIESRDILAAFGGAQVTVADVTGSRETS